VCGGEGLAMMFLNHRPDKPHLERGKKRKGSRKEMENRTGQLVKLSLNERFQDYRWNGYVSYITWGFILFNIRIFKCFKYLIE
jgi:hypothetical protein